MNISNSLFSRNVQGFISLSKKYFYFTCLGFNLVHMSSGIGLGIAQLRIAAGAFQLWGCVANVGRHSQDQGNLI